MTWFLTAVPKINLEDAGEAALREAGDQSLVFGRLIPVSGREAAGVGGEEVEAVALSACGYLTL